MSTDITSPLNHYHHHKWLWLIVTLYLLLGIGYSIASPVFETPDENHHYFTIQAIKTTQTLPIADQNSHARQEAAQPPLYYLLASILTAPLKVQESPLSLNPYHPYRIKNETPFQNRNIFIHTPAESWPWQEQTLALHLIRFFSISLGLGTLLFIYASARLFWLQKPAIALLATALIAFLPQFIFINSSASNDSLIIFMSSAVLWQLIRIWQKGSTTINLIGLGLTIGLAILSKMTGVLLFAYTIGTLILLAWHSHNWRNLIKNIFLISIPVLIVSGWLFWRNWVLYGDPTAVNQFIAFAGGKRNYSLQHLWNDMDRVWKSFFAFFGWMTIEAPSWIYAIWNGLFLAAIIGIFLNLFHQYRQPKINKQTSKKNATDYYLQHTGFTVIWMASWCVLVILAWLNFVRQTSADQGRLWFPALLPIALGLAYGLSKLPKRIGLIGAPILALTTAVYTLFWLITPTFASHNSINLTDIPPAATTLNATMGHGLTLLSAEVETKSAFPGDTLYATLYWQMDNPPQNSPTLSIVGQGQKFAYVAILDTLHNSGINPAHTWQNGEIIADKVAIHLNEETAVPALIHLSAQLNDDGPQIEFGQVKAVPTTQTPLQQNPLAKIGDHIQLTKATLNNNQAQPNETIQIQLQWQALTPPDQSLTAFVHIGPANAPPLAQLDTPPPFPTYVWDSGDTITDTVNITLPEDIPVGDYSIHTGFYDSSSGERLPITINGVNQPNHVYQIDTLHIMQSP